LLSEDNSLIPIQRVRRAQFAARRIELKSPKPQASRTRGRGDRRIGIVDGQAIPVKRAVVDLGC
jgi:hypothetical protein